MIEAFKNLFAVSDLRKRVLFTFAMLTVYRLGGHIPTPGVNPQALLLLAEQAAQNTMFGLYDMFSGQNLSRMSLFALGIMPYISSSIILQLLTVVWPYLEPALVLEPRARLGALVAAPGRLPLARSLSAADPLLRVLRAFRGFEIAEIHVNPWC